MKNQFSNCDIKKILTQLAHEHNVALVKLKVAKQTGADSYIKAMQKEVNQSAAAIRTAVLNYQKNCKADKGYSNFSLLGICFDQACKDAKRADQIAAITTQCQADNDLPEGVDNCIRNKTALLDTPDATGSGSTTSSGGGMDIANILKGFGIKIPGLGGGTTTTPPANPTPPTTQKTVLGMDPVLGWGVIIVGSAGLVWGVFELVKYMSKQPVAATA